MSVTNQMISHTAAKLAKDFPPALVRALSEPGSFSVFWHGPCSARMVAERDRSKGKFKA
jgi:hypothetical protein